MAVGADGEININSREDEVVILLGLSILHQVQSGQFRVRNDLLGFEKKSFFQSWHGLIVQGEINDVFKHFDLTGGGAAEGTVLQNQLLQQKYLNPNTWKH